MRGHSTSCASNSTGWGSSRPTGPSWFTRDDNFGHRLGWKEIIVYPTGGQGIAESNVPSRSSSDELRTYPSDELSSPLNQTEARAELAPGATGTAPEARALTHESDLFAGSFTSLIERELTPGFFFVALLLALGFGAVHALGPGHGKTVMAAYLMGAEGRMRDALFVGVAVSAMHTLSVVALGLLTLWAAAIFPADAVYPWLSLVSGVVVLALGAWLLRVRLKARAAKRAHVHHHEHASEHSHAHEHRHDRVLVGAGGPEIIQDGHDHGFGYHTHAPSELPPGVSVTSWRGLGAIVLVWRASAFTECTGRATRLGCARSRRLRAHAGCRIQRRPCGSPDAAWDCRRAGEGHHGAPFRNACEHDPADSFCGDDRGAGDLSDDECGPQPLAQPGI